MRHVDLCSGIGGFALGFEWAGLSKPVMFCDIEPWSRKILAKHWPEVPIAHDVKELASDPERLVPDCDIITAGYPCQPFSFAGVRRGEKDDRHIWPEIFAIVKAKLPSWCVFENVYGHVSMGLDTVLSDLESQGYSCQPFIVPACSVDAPHRRDRIWIIARAVSHTKGIRPLWFNESTSNGKGGGKGLRPKPSRVCGGKPNIQHVGYTSDNRCYGWAKATGREGAQNQQDEPQLEVWSKSSRPSADVANTNGISLQGVGPERHDARQAGLLGGEAGRKKNFWELEPRVGRVVNGLPRRVDRIRGLGNAIVPQIAQKIGLAIKMVELDDPV